MKKTKITALILIFAVFFSLTASAENAVPAVSGESSHTETELYPGVTHAEIYTPSTDSTYKNQHINVISFDLKQRDLYLDTFYYNKSATKLSTVPNDITQYNSTHSDKTAIAAVNGDMWMVAYSQARIEGKEHTNAAMQGYTDDVVKKEMTVSRSYNVVDGEIYTSGTIPQETPYAGPSWSFGITDDFVPVLGQPTVDITATDKTNGKSVKIDGINRLPANNSVIMYTDRLMGSLTGFALDSSYEILIEFDKDYTPAHGMNVTGTVKAIYGPDDTENPGKLNEKQMVLTSRGTTVTKLKQFAIGDKINITVSVGDIQGNDEQWQRVQSAIGGNIVYIKNGVLTGNSIESGYPTTMLGYDKYGKILMITMDGRNKGGAGATAARYTQLIKDLELYEAFILDGGGSMTMTVADNAKLTSYKTVSTPTDTGGVRTVNNAFILAVGPERGEQGEFEIELPAEIDDPTNLVFPTKTYVASLISTTNQATASWENGCLKLTVKDFDTRPGMADPYAALSYSNVTTKASAGTYKYITYVYKIPETNGYASYGSEVFCQCEGRGAEGGQSVTGTVKRTGKYEYVTFNASSLSKWKGSITGLRLDFFYGSMKEGDCIYIHNVILSDTKANGDKKGAETAEALNAPATPGDVNGDGAKNNKDVIALFKYVSGDTSAVTLTDALDFNNDGAVNNKDVTALFKAVST